MEPLNEIAHSVHAQPYLDVSQERAHPMTLPLPGKLQRLVPETMRDPMRQARDDRLNRRMMSRPIVRVPNRVHTPAVRTPPSPKPQRAGIAIKIPKHKPMSPDPGTSAPLAQTPLRSWKPIILPQPENLLDTHHEKKGTMSRTLARSGRESRRQ